MNKFDFQTVLDFLSSFNPLYLDALLFLNNERSKIENQCSMLYFERYDFPALRVGRGWQAVIGASCAAGKSAPVARRRVFIPRLDRCRADIE